MSFLSQDYSERNNKVVTTLLSFIPISKTFHIVRHSRYLQKIINISLEHYQIFDYIKQLLPSVKKNFNLKYFEKCGSKIRTTFPNVSRVIIGNLFFRLVQEYFDLVCTKIVPDVVLSEHQSGVQCIIQDEEGKHLLSCSNEEIKIWELNTLKCTNTIHDEVHSKFLRSIYLLKDSNYLISISYGMKIVLWNLRENTSQLLFNEKELVSIILQLKNGKLVLGCEDSSIKIYDFNTKEIEDKMEGNIGAIRSMCELADGRLATGGLFATICIWDLSLKIVETVLSGHNGTIQVLIQLSNGDLVSGSGDWTIKIWNNEEEKQTLLGHKDVLRGLIEKKNVDNQLISVSEDNVIKLWNITTGQIIFSLIHCHQDILFSCVCLQDGRVVSCSQDKQIKIWNIDAIFDKFKQTEYPILFVKEKDSSNDVVINNNSVNNNNNAHINLMNIMKSGTSNNVKRPFEYLPFAVINEQSAPY